MTLRTIQTEARAWRAHNFDATDYDTWLYLSGMMEELGELAHCLLKRDQRIREFADGSESLEEAADAIGDLIIFCLGLCDTLHLDLQDVLDVTWAEVRKRDWKADPQKGGEQV